MGQAKSDICSDVVCSNSERIYRATSPALDKAFVKKDTVEIDLKITNIVSLSLTKKSSEIVNDKENSVGSVEYDCYSVHQPSISSSNGIQQHKISLQKSENVALCDSNQSDFIRDNLKRASIFSKSMYHSDFSNLALLSEAAFTQSLHRLNNAPGETPQDSSSSSSSDAASCSGSKHRSSSKGLARVRNNEACRKSRMKKKKHIEEIVVKMKILSDANAFMKKRIKELEVEVAQTRSIVYTTLSALVAKDIAETS